MFSRVTVFLLLLVLNVPGIESVGKIDENINDKRKWELLPNIKVEGVKNRTADLLSFVVVGASSTENPEFWYAFDKLLALLHPDFVAEVCGDDKKMNRYQYFKFWRSASVQYVAIPATNEVYVGYDDAPKDDLEVNIVFDQTDKNGIKTEMEFDVTLKALFMDGSYGECGPFVITKIVQGGTCLEHGKFAHSSSHGAEDFEKLQSHPDALTFLNMFTPRVFRIPEDGKISAESILPKSLPSDWLLSLAPDAKLTVCHENGIVDYTNEQFLSWYQRFVQMWHPKRGDEEAMKMQLLELKDGRLVARLTFKLQIGVNDTAPLHEWNFKVSAKLMLSTRTWSITQLDVFCALSIKLMDESYLVYRDVLGATFNSYVKDNEQWYFATDFGSHFKKHGESVELWCCKEKIERFDDLPKSFFVQNELRDATVMGYMNFDPLNSLPAAEDTSFTIRVKIQYSTENASYAPPPGYYLGVDWKFYIKWDKMDQFYYIYKADFKCPGWMNEKTNEWQMVEAWRKFQPMGRK